jgi:hypothetical protein
MEAVMSHDRFEQSLVKKPSVVVVQLRNWVHYSRGLVVWPPNFDHIDATTTVSMVRLRYAVQKAPPSKVEYKTDGSPLVGRVIFKVLTDTFDFNTATAAAASNIIQYVVARPLSGLNRTPDQFPQFATGGCCTGDMKDPLVVVVASMVLARLDELFTRVENPAINLK